METFAPRSTFDSPFFPSNDSINQANNLDLVISDRDKLKYDHLFKSADLDKDGKLNAEEVFFLRHSKLSTQVLGKIWELSDLDQDRCLNKNEFRLAMHLIYSCLRGCMLPDKLPQPLIMSSKSSVGQKNYNRALLDPTAPSNYDFRTKDDSHIQTYSPSMRRKAQQNESSSHAFLTSSGTGILNASIQATALPGSMLDGDPFQVAAVSMKAAFQSLEKGNHKEALSYVEKALSLLTQLPGKQREIEVCNNYKAALVLLIEIKLCDEENSPEFAAIFSRFLGEIMIQPKHRIVCVRMAINKNMQMKNYGIASRFLLELIPLHPVDASSLESKLTVCQENQYKNHSLLNYTCEKCHSTCLSSAKVCQHCFTPIDYHFFIEQRRQNRSQLQTGKEPSFVTKSSNTSSTISTPTKSTETKIVAPPTATKTREQREKLNTEIRELKSKEPVIENRLFSNPPQFDKAQSSPHLGLRSAGLHTNNNSQQESRSSLLNQQKLKPQVEKPLTSEQKAQARKTLNLDDNFRKNLEKIQTTPTKLTNPPMKTQTSPPTNKNQNDDVSKNGRERSKSEAPAPKFKPSEEPTFLQKNANKKTQLFPPPSFVDVPPTAPEVILKAENKRDQAIKELLETERTYVKGLDIVVNLYLKPMQTMQDSNNIEKQNVKDIFSVIEVIHNINKLFLSQLETRIVNQWNDTGSMKIGDIFIQLGEFMKVYTTYVNNYTLALVTVADLKQRSSQFAQLLEDNRKRSNNLDFQSYLIQPIQRLPRYILLITEIIVHTTPDHPDHGSLNKALEKMKSIAEYINEKKRESENMNAVLQVAEQILFPSGMNEHLIQPSRRFVRKGTLKQVLPDGTQKNKFCFLFNDILIVTRASHSPLKGSKLRESRNGIQAGDDNYYRYKSTINLSQCSISDVTDGVVTSEDGTRCPDIPAANAFELTIFKEGKITWVANSPNEKHEWFSDIDKQVERLLSREKTFNESAKVSSTTKLHSVFSGSAQVHTAINQSSMSTSPTGVTAAAQKPNLPTKTALPSQRIFVWDLLDREWDMLLSSGDDDTVSMGEVISDTDRLYRIVEGKVTVSWSTPSGELIQSNILTNGSLFNYRAILRSNNTSMGGNIINSLYKPDNEIHNLYNVNHHTLHKPNEAVVVRGNAFTPADHLRVAFTVSSEKLELQSVELGSLARTLRVQPELAWRFYKYIATRFCRHLISMESTMKMRERKEMRGTRELARMRSKEARERAPNSAKPIDPQDEKDKKFQKLFPLVKEQVVREFVVDYKSSLTAFRGTLFITSKHMCIASKIFGFQQKSILSFESIVNYDKISGGTSLSITRLKNKSQTIIQLTLENEKELNELYSLMQKLCVPLENSQKLPNNSSAFGIEQKMKVDELGRSILDVQLTDSSSLTEDWKTILKGAECRRYKRGEVIVKEGEKNGALFQITHGRCMVTKEASPSKDEISRIALRPQRLGTIESGEIFGEIDFMEGDGASASVVAEAEEVEVWKIHRSSLNVLFELHPELAVRFFKYLAIVIEKRLYQRERQFLTTINPGTINSDDQNEDYHYAEGDLDHDDKYENPFDDDDD